MHVRLLARLITRCNGYYRREGQDVNSDHRHHEADPDPIKPQPRMRFVRARGTYRIQRRSGDATKSDGAEESEADWSFLHVVLQRPSHDRKRYQNEQYLSASADDEIPDDIYALRHREGEIPKR